MQTTLTAYFSSDVVHSMLSQDSAANPHSILTDNSSLDRNASIPGKTSESVTFTNQHSDNGIKSNSHREDALHSVKKEQQNTPLADDIDWTKLKKLSEDLDGTYWSFDPLTPRKRKAVQCTFGTNEMKRVSNVKKKGKKREAKKNEKVTSKVISSMKSKRDDGVNKLTRHHHHRHHHHHHNKHHHSDKTKDNSVKETFKLEVVQELKDEDILPPNVIDQPVEQSLIQKQGSVIPVEAKSENLSETHQPHKHRKQSTTAAGLDGTYWAIDDTKPRRRTQIEFFSEQEQHVKRKKKSSEHEKPANQKKAGKESTGSQINASATMYIHGHLSKEASEADSDGKSKEYHFAINENESNSVHLLHRESYIFNKKQTVLAERNTINETTMIIEPSAFMGTSLLGMFGDFFTNIEADGVALKSESNDAACEPTTVSHVSNMSVGNEDFIDKELETAIKSSDDKKKRGHNNLDDNLDGKYWSLAEGKRKRKPIFFDDVETDTELEAYNGIRQSYEMFDFGGRKYSRVHPSFVRSDSDSLFDKLKEVKRKQVILTPLQIEERKRKAKAYYEKIKQIRMLEKEKSLERSFQLYQHLFFGNDVITGLSVGARQAAQNREFLENDGITAILNVAKEVPLYFPNDYVSLHLPLVDSEEEDIEKYFQSAFNFITENRKHGKVFVHCNRGMSRSVAIVVAYLIVMQKFTFDAALHLVEVARGETRMNFGFLRTLKAISEKNESSQQQKTLTYSDGLNTFHEKVQNERDEVHRDGVTEREWNDDYPSTEITVRL